MSKFEQVETVKARDLVVAEQAEALEIVVEPVESVITLLVSTKVAMPSEFLKDVEANTATVRTMLDKLFKDLGGDVVGVDII